MPTARGLNRSYLKITPSELFWQQVRNSNGELEFIDFHEPSVYLLEEDIWDNEIILEKYYITIAKVEYSQHMLEVSDHLLPDNLEGFLELFDFELGSTVLDLIANKPLAYL
jgi:hypothetical protein